MTRMSRNLCGRPWVKVGISLILSQTRAQRYGAGAYAISYQLIATMRMNGAGYNAINAVAGGTKSMQILGV